jgi:hypothetical protein
MIKIFALATSMTILVGCASNNSMTPEQKQAILMQHQETKTFEIECETGCKIAYKDPRDQVTLPRETNGYDVANTTIKSVTGIVTSTVPWAAVGAIAVQGINNAGNNTTYNDSFNQTADPTVVNPEVVNAPAPVIVNPEIVNPEVVTTPDPVIVNPEIVITPDPVIVETNTTPAS